MRHLDLKKLELTEEEQAEISQIEAEIHTLERGVTKRLREMSYSKGIAAPKLEDLISKSGDPFKEVEPSKDIRDRRRASSGAEENREFAYFCGNSLLNSIGCGWVKGSPNKEEYNELGPALSGSAGTLYTCYICGDIIERNIRIVS